MCNMLYDVTKLVKRPRRVHTCNLCGQDISGEHVSHAGKLDSDFNIWRVHIECLDRSKVMCGECDVQDDCQSNIEECFKEKWI